MSTGEINQRLQRILQQSTRLSPAARARLNEQLRSIRQGIEQHLEQRPQVRRATNNHNGGHTTTQQERFITAPPATQDVHMGGQHRPRYEWEQQ